MTTTLRLTALAAAVGSLLFALPAQTQCASSSPAIQTA